ncbi:DegV family protein [Streptococcus zalophi]|uniref:DegV family protein n=1 Tax=Streptococcus zalophi TaxID=640031 RepID=A0A934P980_9STRE|nr:DegV family protein [Streptococcus zalophi]MBJ8349235.1 DegV family protein [Streptococcus zalophi]MCR8967142.1 DegV family protein [Streptococcus zalophi]
MTWKIVTDSGSDFRNLPNLAPDTSFELVPLSLTIGDRVFVDSKDLDVEEMMTTMYSENSAALSACPSPEAFKNSYKDSNNVIVVTITGALSGSNNSAQVAKKMLLEENPNINIHVFDSLSAGGEMDLFLLEANRLIKQGLTFEEVIAQLEIYLTKTRLLFILSKVDNLVKNGRLNKLIGTVVGLLNIRMVGRASEEGKLELLHKPRGQKKAVVATFEEMLKSGYNGGRVMIAHSNNLKICQQLEEKIKNKFPQADFKTLPASGLCSFYAEEGGILLGYEVE